MRRAKLGYLGQALLIELRQTLLGDPQGKVVDIKTDPDFVGYRLRHGCGKSISK